MGVLQGEQEFLMQLGAEEQSRRDITGVEPTEKDRPVEVSLFQLKPVKCNSVPVLTAR